MTLLTEHLKKRTRNRLGEPIVAVEISDEQMQDNLTEAKVAWSLYSNLSNLDDKKLIPIEEDWVETYFQALCKETLGIVRGKYRGTLPIPGSELTLEFESLLKDSLREKDDLIGLLIPPTDKIILAAYINVGNMDGQEVSAHMEKTKKQLGGEKGYKYFFIPVRDQESKIECVYPSVVYDEPMKEKLNSCLDDIINSIKNE